MPHDSPAARGRRPSGARADLIGCGRSDKPARFEDYPYLRHVEWVTSWFERLDVNDVTLFVQDWGSP